MTPPNNHCHVALDPAFLMKRVFGVFFTSPVLRQQAAEKKMIARECVELVLTLESAMMAMVFTMLNHLEICVPADLSDASWLYCPLLLPFSPPLIPWTLSSLDHRVIIGRRFSCKRSTDTLSGALIPVSFVRARKMFDATRHSSSYSVSGSTVEGLHAVILLSPNNRWVDVRACSSAPGRLQRRETARFLRLLCDLVLGVSKDYSPGASLEESAVSIQDMRAGVEPPSSYPLESFGSNFDRNIDHVSGRSEYAAELMGLDGIYIYIYMCVCIYIYMCVYLYLYIYIYVCMYVSLYVCVYVYICVFVCIYVCMCPPLES